MTSSGREVFVDSRGTVGGGLAGGAPENVPLRPLQHWPLMQQHRDPIWEEEKKNREGIKKRKSMYRSVIDGHSFVHSFCDSVDGEVDSGAVTNGPFLTVNPISMTVKCRLIWMCANGTCRKFRPT